MPVTRGAEKKLRQDKKRTLINLLAKNKTKEAIKKFKSSPTMSSLSTTFSLLDNLRKKNIYHANKVARLKSSLNLYFNKKGKKDHKQIKNTVKKVTAKKSTKKATA